MKQSITERHSFDGEGNPAGGKTIGRGIFIEWQDGPVHIPAPIGMFEPDINGALVEGVIAAAIGRLRFYQSTDLRCVENESAIIHLEAALGRLDERRNDA